MAVLIKSKTAILDASNSELNANKSMGKLMLGAAKSLGSLNLSNGCGF